MNSHDIEACQHFTEELHKQYDKSAENQEVPGGVVI